MILFPKSWNASRAVPLALFLIAILITCSWVLTLPVFPSQDGPLHLYYANVFSELLRHHSGLYADSYRIRAYLPPYATYYYGLVLLARVVSLETADKIMVCLCAVLLALGVREILSAVRARWEWTALLILPVLLCWPLVMGFISYSLGVSLACFAMAAWCREVEEARLRHQVWFLALVVATVITHPIPWLVVVGFAGFELASRVLAFTRSASRPDPGRWKRWRTDVGVCLLACTPAIYVAHFRGGVTQDLDVVDPSTGLRLPHLHPSLMRQVHLQWFDLRHLFGLILFEGAGASHLYRLGLYAMWLGLIAAAVFFQIRPTRPSRTYLSRVWFYFSLALALCLILVPDDLDGGYFFSTRLQIVVYISLLAAAAVGLGEAPMPAVTLGLFGFLLSCFTVVLSSQFITPVAREIATLRAAPAISTRSPGLAMRTPGLFYPPHLRVYSFYWAPVNYLRWHELLLFNTAWLGDPIIPVAPRTGSLPFLDDTFYNESPQFGGRLLANEEAARATLGKVGFVVFTRQAGFEGQNPFAETQGQAAAGHFAEGWTCKQNFDETWYLCTSQPPVVGRR